MTAQEIKNSILQYAVQGKLVPQNPNDEPAELLLQKIKAEKQQLIKEKKIKAEKPLAPISEEEIPFEIPESWVWVRLGEISINRDGARIPVSQKEREAKEKIYPYYGASGVIDKIDGYTHDGVFLLIGEDGANLRAKSTPIAFIASGKIWVNNHAHVLEYIDNILLRYMVYCLNIMNINPYISGGFQPKLSQSYLNLIPIPLPPLSEQQRIVQKIEELMPLVEAYDKAEKELTVLNTKFPEQIKKSVLQYAIQGKLVPQNPHDEPASALLQKIKAEKAKLIKEKKIKAEKPLAPITEEEIPFEIPESWEWVRLGVIANKLTDGTHYTPKYTENGIPFLSVKDMSSGKLNFSNTKFISEEEHKILFGRCNPERGDLLLTKVGTTGIPVIVDTDRDFSLFVSVALIKFSNELIDSRFLVHLMNSPLVQIQCSNATKGVGNKNWVMRDIANTLIVLPPLAEQQRIVEKVEEVLRVCDKLK